MGFGRFVAGLVRRYIVAGAFEGIICASFALSACPLRHSHFEDEIACLDDPGNCGLAFSVAGFEIQTCCWAVFGISDQLDVSMVRIFLTLLGSSKVTFDIAEAPPNV